MNIVRAIMYADAFETAKRAILSGDAKKRELALRKIDTASQFLKRSIAVTRKINESRR
jgi:hypothetical protein